MGGEDGLDIVEEFYADESKPERHEQSHVQEIHKGLQQSVQSLN